MSFEKGVKEAADKFKALKPEKVTLVFHDDSDGVCSAALAKRALNKIDIEPEIICLEKTYPEIVRRFHAREGVFIYLEIGSGMIDLLTEHAKTPTFVLNHHKTHRVKSDRVIHVNPELYEYSGDEEVSGSVVTYLFMRELADLEEIADLAAIGATEIPGNLRGLNRENMKGVEVKDSNGRESYRALRFKRRARSVAKDLTILAAVGYQRGGPELAVNLCLFGYNDEIRRTVQSLEEERKRRNRELLDGLKLNETDHLQWFDSGNAFQGMGVKVIGTFCSYLRFQRVHPEKYILGFMDVQSEVPNVIGLLSKKYSKVSARCPRTLEDLVRQGSVPEIAALLRAACAHVEGFGDGHATTASGVIPRGRREEFLRKMEELIGKETGVSLVSYL
jgi:single-stranded-DNA-specific exonuclease